MGRKHILLIDDDPLTRGVIRDAFDGHYAVIEASCYLEAVKFSNHHIDLALIDYILPDSDGFNALKVLRHENPNLPAIIMTAYGSESVAVRAIREKVTDYITKPLEISYLKQRVSEIFKEETITRHHGKGRKGDHREFIWDGMVTYIEEHYSKHLTLDMLARKVSMNKYRFCKSFKLQTGRTFTSYLNNVRIRNATGLLEKADLNITEIAYSVGYRNLVHFARVFKELHGISPREYRKKIKGDKSASL